MRLLQMVRSRLGISGGSADSGGEGLSGGPGPGNAPARRAPLMDVSVRQEADGRFIVSCPDQLGRQARLDLVEAVVKSAAGDRVAAIVLDLEQVQFMNSAGLGAIFALRKYAQQADAQMVIAAAGPSVLRLFRTVNLPALVPLAASVDEARTRLSAAR